jgi:hypothetical protein
MQVHLKFEGYDAAPVVSVVTQLLRNVRLVYIYDGLLYMCVWKEDTTRCRKSVNCAPRGV